MRRLFLVLVITACGSSSDHGVVDGWISGELGGCPSPYHGCNPLAQVGCCAGEKCTWRVDAYEPQYVGHIGCAPDGAAAVGEPCGFGAAGQDGFDNCVAGSVCGDFRGGAGVCKQLCDQQGGTPTCDATHVCITYSGLFSSGATTPNAAGVCDLACDPLADDDFDGSGSGLSKTGTICGSGDGCYGYPSFGTLPRTGFACHPERNPMRDLRHRTECTTATGCAEADGSVYLESCSQGYLPLLRESTAVSTTICVAMCAPKNCYAGNCGTNDDDRFGAAPHRCNAIDARGTFDTGSNGDQCEFLWDYEIDDQGNFLRSPYSDTLGFCFDHSQYLYDSNYDTVPDTVLPSCASLPDGFGSGSAFRAADLGCVDSSHAGLAFTGKRPRERAVELRPLRARAGW